MTYFPHVIQAVPRSDFHVYAYFSDGSVRLADIHPLVEAGGVFSVLQDPEFFQTRLTVINGAVAWDVTGDRNETKCIDLDPVKMYETSPIVKDPLEDISA